MARYSQSFESQTTQLGGVNATTTVNGYVGYWGASATVGFRMRRLVLGVRTTTGVVPTSQQVGCAIHRQTVAPAGTGLAAAVLGQPFELQTAQTDPTTGVIVTTATTIGTTAPTIAAVPLAKFNFNTQNSWDVPFELLEELTCNLGTANGLAFVSMYNTLPTNHIMTFTVEIEV